MWAYAVDHAVTRFPILLLNEERLAPALSYVFLVALTSQIRAEGERNTLQALDIFNFGGNFSITDMASPDPLLTILRMLLLERYTGDAIGNLRKPVKLKEGSYLGFIRLTAQP